jgi:hypothetical protein
MILAISGDTTGSLTRVCAALGGGAADRTCATAGLRTSGERGRADGAADLASWIA